jgi:hypothetical protein
MLTIEELKNAKYNVMTIMENRIMQMTSCDRTTANLVANEILNLDRESEQLLCEKRNLKDARNKEIVELATSLNHFCFRGTRTDDDCGGCCFEGQSPCPLAVFHDKLVDCFNGGNANETSR